MGSNKSSEYLYQILGVRSTDVTYPYCKNCYKKVFYLNNKKKWNCTSCNEEFNQVNHRYKLSLEITNFNELRYVTAFGKQLEFLFGIESNNFYKYRYKCFNEPQTWTDCLETAFKYCLVGRWLIFEIKELKENLSRQSSSIVNNIRKPSDDLESLVPIYEYLSNRPNLAMKFNLNVSSSFDIVDAADSSVINETLNETTSNDNYTNNLCSLIASINIQESLNSVVSKKASLKLECTSTPLVNRTLKNSIFFS